MTPLQRTLLALAFGFAALLRGAEPEPLFDWSPWEQHRVAVAHPSGAIKPADLARARENLQRYPWAKSHLASLERAAQAALRNLSPEYLSAMIPETTPGDSKFTPCPACRDLGKPVHPHGLWSWSASAPDELVCDMCHTRFPNEKYPESVVLHTTHGKPQELTFYGGEPFVIFSYRTGRPSFTANIRARKVAHLASACRSLAEAFLLTGKPEYAAGVRLILLRFAACYPGWLVHCGYGEYADLDPRLAAQFINALPVPELCPPPNKPDRKLHTGYWSAGRASGVGQESGFVRKMVEAYDFTCTARTDAGAPLYSDAERRTIERDLLLEGSLLLVADKQINNKSVGNRTAAALVGLCVGHPGLVQFGRDGFQKTINDWFLPDGTTSESPAYATMTLGNIWDLGQSLRGHVAPGENRADDPYHGTAYERVWQNCFNGLQGDLKYPPSADSYRTSSLGENFVELMVANYPERPEYLALLKALCGPDLTRAYAPVALYYREPGLEQRPSPALAFPDFCPPELRIGHMRTGADGRESLLLLSASHWGNHHHEDSLNLYYWKQGAEVLSDLGYLWDHPKKHQAGRTVAHNTVLIDEKDQATRTRDGEVLFFRSSEHVKVMSATSRAYPDAPLYRRTSALVDHGGGRSYVVDFFRVQGGATQDYVFHGAAATCELLDTMAQAVTQPLYDFNHARAIESTSAWRATWKSGALTCIAWNLPQPGERAWIADGWGQRDWKNSDIGATVPYIIRRTQGPDAKLFLSVFEATADQPFVRKVTSLDGNTIAIETTTGTDYVLSPLESGETRIPPVTLRGKFAVASVHEGKVTWEFSER
jgi:hypothetical protein